MCPVCRARFRGSRECSRCGADLTVIMTLAATAWRMRKSAREALREGDMARANALAAEAESICHTEAGKHLSDVAQALATAADAQQSSPWRPQSESVH